MQNYFNYFTEIEERFQQRRGSLLMLSTLDWALIETWREAGVPLEAVLRGIDNAFDKHDAKALRSPSRSRKVNGLAWCAQSVMEATEQAMEALIGATPGGDRCHREWLRNRTGGPVSGTQRCYHRGGKTHASGGCSGCRSRWPAACLDRGSARRAGQVARRTRPNVRSA